MPVRATIVGLLTILATPSLAFDDLIRFSAVIAETPQSSHVFDYAAPREGFAGNGNAHAVLSDLALAVALHAGANPDEMTGINFGDVSAILTAGDSPNRVTVLFGPQGFADGATDILPARDFSETVVEGYQVFAKGADYAVDLAIAGQPDPFASALGNAQRLAIGGDFLIRTAGWPELNSALTALHRPSLDAGVWRAMFDAIRAASADGAKLTRAGGWLGQAFLAESSGPPSSKHKSANSGFTILFPMATIAVTESETLGAIHIALPYDDAQTAQLAATEISQRLVRHPFTPSTPRIDLVDITPFTIAVLSIDIPQGAATSADTLYTGWMSDITKRRFSPLYMRF